MKNAIIIHGSCDKQEYFSDKYPSLSNSHWLPWLQKQLLINGIYTQTPEMPEALDDQLDYAKWSRELERYDINEETILIGHSSGTGFLLRWLSENKVRIDKLILIAPWLDPNKKRAHSFFDFQIDQNLVDRVNSIHILVSEDDDDDILASAKTVNSSISKINNHIFKDYGHFILDHMKTDKFPELLSIILE